MLRDALRLYITLLHLVKTLPWRAASMTRRSGSRQYVVQEAGRVPSNQSCQCNWLLLLHRTTSDGPETCVEMCSIALQYNDQTQLTQLQLPARHRALCPRGMPAPSRRSINFALSQRDAVCFRVVETPCLSHGAVQQMWTIRHPMTSCLLRVGCCATLLPVLQVTVPLYENTTQSLAYAWHT